jgi:polysaccharide export outer membrane protein
MSADVTVRPDGKISLPLLNDLQATGLTTEQLRLAITEAATKFVEDPTVSVVVKQINSRVVYVTGMVNKPGPYPVLDKMTVLQLLTLAGGVQEYAKSDKIVILRTEKGVQRIIPFNYKELLKGKNLKQNIELIPGDSVAVP